MTREWTEFVQSQWLPWEAGGLGGRRPGVETRRLSHDPDTGAASLLVRYPAGYRRAGVEHLAVDEELLVIDGSFTLNDRTYGDKAYAHLPGGCTRSGMASDTGAVVLTFLSGVADARPGEGTCDARRLVAHADGYAIPYTGNFHPEFPPGAGRKMLYEDPVSGNQTWLLGTLPMRWAQRQEVHPVVEEMYLLAGEVHGNRGVMRPGAYFWRPPGIPHGPYGSMTGNLYLFRTEGGRLATEYVDADRAFRWWPEYDLELPPSMAGAAGEPPPGVRCY